MCSYNITSDDTIEFCCSYALHIHTVAVLSLQNSISETMVIRSAIQYDPNIGGFDVVNADSGERKQIQIEVIKGMFGEELYHEHMKFITSFNTAAQWDKATMVLTMLINLFASDRPGIVDKYLMAQAEVHYSELLQAYLKSRYTLSEANAIYPRLLQNLVDVRTYGEMSKKAIEKVSVSSNPNVQPLLQEVFSSCINK